MTDINTQYDGLAMDLLDEIQEAGMMRGLNGNFLQTQVEILSGALYQQRVDAIRECIALAELSGNTKLAASFENLL